MDIEFTKYVEHSRVQTALLGSSTFTFQEGAFTWGVMSAVDQEDRLARITQLDSIQEGQQKGIFYT